MSEIYEYARYSSRDQNEDSQLIALNFPSLGKIEE